MGNLLFSAILLLFAFSIQAQQNVGIGTTTPHASAQLEVQGVKKGMLVPRMNSADMTTIPSPAQGLIVYNTDRGQLFYYENGAWNELALAGDNVWSKNGSFIYKNNPSNVGIGTINPASLFHVMRGSAGGVLPFGATMTVESGTDATISLLNPDNASNSIHFGLNSNNFSGAISYNAGFNRKGFDFRTKAGNTRMVIDSFGNVGIGDLAPLSRLSVKTDDDFVGRFDGGTGMYIGLYEQNVFRGYLGSVSGAAADIDLGTAATNIAGKVNLTTQSIPRFTIATNGTAQVLGTNMLEFGFGLTKDVNAGKIGYNAFGQNALTFTGAGTTTSNRAVFFYAEGGTGYNGRVYINDPVSGDRRIDMKPAESSTTGATMLLYNAAGELTIELDADYVDGDGRIITRELQINGGSDLAEHFNITKSEDIIKKGMLVSIDETREGQLKITNEANDRKVVGVISGANGIKAGMLMGQTGTLADGEFPVALAGRVYVLANKEGGEINAGDFLSSSSQKGYAKKAGKLNNAQGAIIGKAMGKIDANGYVLVLVNLQ